MKIFVYGTLLSGQGNHPLIEASTYLGKAATEPRYTMLHLGGFPGVVRAGSAVVVGEVYEVDDRTLVRLDRLEGHPSFYERTPIEVEMEDGSQEAVSTYLLPLKWLEDKRLPVIENGDWLQRGGERE